MKKFIVDKGTHIKSKNTTNKIMIRLFVSLLPIIIFSIYKNGYIPYINKKSNIIGLIYPLIFILVPVITSFFGEFLYKKIILKRKDSILDNLNKDFSIFPGLFLGLILPINTPLYIVVIGALGATIIGKMIFGGFGQNIFNPALIGNLLVITVYGVIITNSGGYLNNLEIDSVTSATPLSNVTNGIGNYQELVEPYGNLWDFFIGTIPGALGETSALLCLLGFIYLTVTKTIKWKIPVVYISTVFIMTYMIGSYNQLGIWYPLFQILSGGLMFGAVFMATDPVTSPTTPIGQIIYGFFLGILTVILRYLTPYPEGVLTSILTLNLFVFVIDKTGYKMRFIFSKSLFMVIWLLIIGLSFYIGNSYNVDSTSFKIINKEINNDQTVYEISDKGYVDDIVLKVTIIKNKINLIEIVKQNESYFGLIEKEDYINQLLKNSSNLSQLDTIAGATITSSTLKNMIEKVIEDYEKTGNKIENNLSVKKSTNFHILEKEKSDKITTYLAKQKGFSGDITARVVVNNGEVTSFIVFSQNDSYFKQLTSINYPDSIKGNENAINSIDTVAGVTISSQAIKDLAINILKDYNG